MKIKYVSIIILFSISCSLKAQIIQQFTNPIFPNAKTEISFRISDREFINSTIIGGAKVEGTPFLFDDWLAGKIILEDGRLYENYKIKYNDYAQTVSFLKDGNSLTIDENIKEFSLMVNTKEVYFINANQFKKEKKPLFYEILVDNPSGQLLKVNRKLVKSNNSALVEVKTAKFLNPVISYFYYDKKSKKIVDIEPSHSDISSALNLTPFQEVELSLFSYDFSNEPELIIFFNSYLKSDTKKQL